MPQCLWQNWRIIEVGRHLWSSPIATTLINAGTTRARCTDCAQLSFEYLQGCSTNSLGNLCSTTTSVKQILLFRWHSLCFDLCPLLLVLSLGTTEKSPPPSSLHHPIRYYMHISDVPPESLSQQSSSNPKRGRWVTVLLKCSWNQDGSGFLMVSFEFGFVVFTFPIATEVFIFFRNKAFIEEKHLL